MIQRYNKKSASGEDTDKNLGHWSLKSGFRSLKRAGLYIILGEGKGVKYICMRN